MRRLRGPCALLALLCPLTALAEGPDTVIEGPADESPLRIEVAPDADDDAPRPPPPPPADEPGTKSCSSGCGDGAKKYVPPLHLDEFQALVVAFQHEPLDPPGEALETLLFHHHDARVYLRDAARVPLIDPAHRALLERELSRTRAWIAFRVVDAEGAVRMRVAPTRVPLTEKQHLLATATDDVQPAEFNGTVVRVGRDHLWVRY